jgi:hypothetical protein
MQPAGLSPLCRRRPGLSTGSICLLVLLYLGRAVAADEGAADLTPEPRQFYVEDIKAAMTRHIAETIDAAQIFHLTDDKTQEPLTLRFMQVHDPVRQIGTEIYFACTDFHVDGEPDQVYDIDFWLNAKTGELRVYETKVHKEPRQSLLYGWYKHPRYTFVNDQIKYLY